MNKRSLFWVTLFVVFGMGINFAQAGPGTKAAPVLLGQPFGLTNTYYANSPAGVWSPDPEVAVPGATPSDSGTAIRKFVDSLPGLGPLGANNLGNYIPVANKAPNPIAGDPADYYEIELVDYRQRLHSDLPAPGTKLRGYRDLTPAGNSGTAHYLGPLIIAKSFDPTRAANVNGNGAPVRIKYKNSLGVGAAGNLFIPVDTTAMGAGEGPLSQIWDPVALTLKPNPNGNKEKYTQNRAELHLHGGVTPWISDGTPHQWFTPAGETTSYKRGVSQVNVPDMPDPGDGYATYYYSNQQSARLMFYHDHAYGMTRLNVYAGEAAGYLLYDQTEQDLISGTDVSGNNPSSAKVLPDNGGGLYTFGIPLIIQDKTFVPRDVAVQDAKWDTTRWGAYGDLWYPHVYEPNQNPLDGLGGANPYGRWDYGPWFWPPVVVPAAYAALPSTGTSTEPSLTPEAFMDTPIVNGALYPYLPVEPKAYRFRILNAANDRPFNLQLYESNPASSGNFIQGGFPTEVAMVPAMPRPDCTATSIAATPAVPSTCTCTATNAPFGCFPATWPTDGRDGGVPDPQFAGPKMIQIGTEGGFLPTPVVLDNQPVSYEYNRRTIVVLDVLDKTLLMGPAERADVIIDFSAYAGKTIILYSDAPAPNPAFDVRYDYFTNAPDQTFQGGAPSTKAGYGPNTRTIMQFRVAASAATPFTANLPTLTTAIQTAFTATQPAPIIPEPDYAANYPGDPSPNLTNAIYSTIFDNSLTFTPLGGGASQTINFEPKAIQELWDPWGRMNATLGVELPKTSNTIQTTIPFGYADPNTERVDDSVVQIWKITHNGVDTHPVHFHLFDVQLINRVGWDGAIRPPDANEIGWKETVKMKPLEDVIVALRPALPALPFGIPTSTRLLDPTLPAGAQNTGLAGIFDGTGAGFMGLNPIDGTPIIVSNDLTDFGHEYVWHCHILGHEENDFMRSMVVNDTSAVPATPTGFAASLGTGAINLSWNDATRPTVLATLGNPRNEVGFHIYRCSGSTTCTPTVLAYTTLANATTFVDRTISANTRYRYRIRAFNAAGESGNSSITTALLTPATLPPYVSITAPASAATFPLGWPITITATASAPVAITRVDFYQSVGAGTPVLIGTSATAPYTFTWNTAALGNYNLTARAVDSQATTTSAIVPISVVAATASITAPTAGTSFTQGTAIPITATATAVSGLTIAQMEFYADGVLVGTSSASPYTYSWTGAATGAHSLTAKAYYANGASVISPAVTLDVLGTTITSPANAAGFNLGAPIAIAATAAPVSGLTVTRVDFFADGVQIGTDATSPYTFTWNGAASGVHSLTARTTYSNAQTASSPAVSIVVLTTTITAPAAGSSFILGVTVPITASVPTVTGGVTVTKVDFFANATLIGTSTTAPYGFTWAPAATGAYNLTATATYSNAATTTSPVVVVSVAPSVKITAPVSGATSLVGAPITITATATPPAGSSAVIVEFYADGAATPIGVGTSSPYNYSWTPATGGAHNLTAKAYYSNGTSSTSTVVSIAVSGTAAAMITPAAASILANASPTFTWTNSGATQYQLWAGSTVGAFNLGATAPITATTVTISGLPVDGSSVYVRLWSLVAGTWVFNDYIYTAASAATIITPTKSTTLTGASQAFSWTSVGADLYQVYVGSSLGAFNIGASAPTTGTTATIAGLPADGSTIFVRLWSKFGITWVFNDYVYIAVSPATMVTPANAATLAGASQTFTWTNAGASLYQVYVGSTLGGADIGAVASTAATTATVNGLPVDGRTVYVRLWSQFGGTWYPKDYTYTAAGQTLATMTTPIPSTTLAGPSQTFTWTNTGALQYQLWVGTSLGAFNVGATAPGTATTATIPGLPANGSTIFVRLWSKFGPAWSSNDYTYVSGP